MNMNLDTINCEIITQPDRIYAQDTMKSVQSKVSLMNGFSLPSHRLQTDPVEPRVKKLVQDYWGIDFPEDPYHHFGTQPTIYIRKAEISAALTETRPVL